LEVRAVDPSRGGAGGRSESIRLGVISAWIRVGRVARVSGGEACEGAQHPSPSDEAAQPPLILRRSRQRKKIPVILRFKRSAIMEES
jgi:hypothetical protein